MDGFVVVRQHENNKNISIYMNPILIGILAFLIFCVVWMNMKREGFKSGSTPKDIQAKIQKMNNELIDSLNMSTYRSSYEESILDLEKWADNSMLTIISQGNLGTDSADKNINTITQFNELAKFKENLNSMMAVLDKTE